MKSVIEKKKNIISSNQTNLNQQLKIVLLAFLSTIIPTTIIFILFKLRTNLTLDLLTRDPLVITNGRFYLGMISNLGILFWCACAAICLYTYALLSKHKRSREISKLLGFSGVFTSFLMLDDLFMLHENFYYYTGINHLLNLAYLGFVVFLFIKNLKVFQKTEFVILLAAMGFFSLSIVYDAVESNNLPIFIEDVFKFLGITTWFTYFLRLCWRELNSIIRLSSSHEVF